MVRAPYVCFALGLLCSGFLVQDVVHASAYCCPIPVCHPPSGHVLDCLVLVLVLCVMHNLSVCAHGSSWLMGDFG